MSQVDYQSLSDLPALQARASTFHDAVCNLVQSYVNASKQVSVSVCVCECVCVCVCVCVCECIIIMY